MKTDGDPEPLAELEAGRRAQGRGALGGFAYDLDGSTPALAVALHSGHAMRAELQPFVCIPEEARYLEEDPATDAMIRGAPNAVWGLDSRAEYDLNRPRERAVPLTPEHFWGVPVYREPLPEALVRRSLDKYDEFYRFVEGCVRRLLERFGFCVVFEIHSYNLARQIAKGIAEPPVFNLGTALTDVPRWRPRLDDWLARLARIEIPGVRTTVAENLVFKGASEFCRRMLALDPRVLDLPTEVGKYYMDERAGRLFEDRVAAIGRGLRAAMAAHGCLGRPRRVGCGANAPNDPKPPR